MKIMFRMVNNVINMERVCSREKDLPVHGGQVHVVEVTVTHRLQHSRLRQQQLQQPSRVVGDMYAQLQIVQEIIIVQIIHVCRMGAEEGTYVLQLIVAVIIIVIITFVYQMVDQVKVVMG
jgi:hypothetical protein